MLATVGNCVFRLRIGAQAPQSAAWLAENTTQRWPGPDGQIIGLSNDTSNPCWFHIEGIGTFFFNAIDPLITVYPYPITTLERLIDTARRVILPHLLQLQGWLVLHASAVLTPHGLLALSAPSGTGKSTCAYGLQSLGYRVWADDVLVLRADDFGWHGLPLPFRLRLRPGPMEYFKPAQTTQLHAPVRQQALYRIYLLTQQTDWEATEPVSIRKLPSSDAFPSLLAQAFCFSLHDPERKARMMQHFLHLSNQIDIYAVNFRSGLAYLPDVLDALRNSAD